MGPLRPLRALLRKSPPPIPSPTIGGRAGVTGGMVLLGPPDSGPFRPIAIWPDVRRNLTHLTGSAERALKERRGLVRRAESEATDPAAAPPRYEIAYPIE